MCLIQYYALRQIQPVGHDKHSSLIICKFIHISEIPTEAIQTHATHNLLYSRTQWNPIRQCVWLNDPPPHLGLYLPDFYTAVTNSDLYAF